jgi:acyl-CoA synthetase (AMP-forming)/AMP-acid ligase II
MSTSLTRRARYANLIDLLARQADSKAEQIAFTFLQDGEQEELNWTYGRLATASRAVASHLQSLNAFGERALLIYPPGLDFIAAFWGCLQSGVIAVPAYPPRLTQNVLRLKAIIEDSQARIVLTDSSSLRRMQSYIKSDAHMAGVKYISTNELSEESSDKWYPPNVDGNSIAFIQYTSGSTQKPKGVVISHSNVLHNEALIQKAFQQSEESVIVNWLPLFHDMGLIGGMLQPVYLGARCILMAPNSFLQQPYRWLSAISRYKATTSGGPNFAYEQCLRKISVEEGENLNLASWKVAFNGAETVRDRTLVRFAERFAKVGFRSSSFVPCYGLAEATLFVSGHVSNEAPVVLDLDSEKLSLNLVVPSSGDSGRRIVSCGQPSPGS